MLLAPFGHKKHSSMSLRRLVHLENGINVSGNVTAGFVGLKMID